MARILVLNGPNLNLLGSREPGLYGQDNLASIEADLRKAAAGHEIDFFQSNAESQLIERIHQAGSDGVDFILINPAALTHAIPFIEVHISNVFAREAFRHRSYLSDVAVGVISGLGTQGYELALAAALRRLNG
jgi:3-dehydroquinate dehydratase-2